GVAAVLQVNRRATGQFGEHLQQTLELAVVGAGGDHPVALGVGDELPAGVVLGGLERAGPAAPVAALHLGRGELAGRVVRHAARQAPGGAGVVEGGVAHLGGSAGGV